MEILELGYMLDLEKKQTPKVMLHLMKVIPPKLEVFQPQIFNLRPKADGFLVHLLYVFLKGRTIGVSVKTVIIGFLRGGGGGDFPNHSLMFPKVPQSSQTESLKFP